MTTDQCLAQDQLRCYLQGWTEPDEIHQIEEHLRHCAACEETLCNLEQEPDTLAEFLREPFSEVEDNHPSQDRVLGYALAKSKSLGQQVELNHRTDALSARLPQQQIGPYQIISALGRGGMGTVYLAKHRELNKQVAIKLLPANKFHDAASHIRFQREFRAVGQLNHPTIVSATDAGEIDGVHFLAMEFVDGFDLSKVARTFGPLRIADACLIVREAALGLSYAHSQGIVHRDIKPSNIMLRTDGVVKLLDFGLAQTSLWDEATAEITTVGQLMGTLDYMAPEQAERPELVDHRADIYSLGATLYRLLTGRPPLVASPDLSPLAKLKLLGSTEAPRLQTLRTDAPDAISKITSQLLDRSPDKRPSSAAHVAELLEPFTKDADLKSLVETTQRLATEQHSQAADEDNIKLQAAPTPASHDGSRSNRYWKWVAAACLPLPIMAGIFIALETQKGQLVIESDEANVQVSIRRDDVVAETIQVIPGTNVTKLYAGKYEVVIDGTPERFSLDKQSITLERGEVAIARITLKQSDHSEELASDQSERPTNGTAEQESTEFTEPIYRGKTISEWMTLFKLERDPAELNTAFEAITRLADGELEAAVEQFLVQEMKSNPDRRLENGEGWVDFTISAAVFNWRMDPNQSPTKIVQFAMGQLNTDDQQWLIRVLPMIPNRIKHLDDQSLEPFFQWCEMAFESNKHSADVYDSIASCLFTLYLNPNKEVRPDVDRLIRLAAESEKFTWTNHAEKLMTASNASAIELLEWLAVKDLEDTNANDRQIATSVVILLTTNGAESSRVGSSQRNTLNRLDAKPIKVTDNLKLSLTAHLNRLAENAAESNRYTITLLGKFAQVDLYNQLQSIGNAFPNTTFGAWTWSSSGSSNVESVLIANLIQLIKLLKIESEFKSYIQKVAQTNRDSAIRTSLQLFPIGFDATLFRQFMDNKKVFSELATSQKANQEVVESTSDLVACLNYWAALEALEPDARNEEFAIYLQALSKSWASNILERYDANKNLALEQDEFTPIKRRNELTQILDAKPFPIDVNTLEAYSVDYYIKKFKSNHD